MNYLTNVYNLPICKTKTVCASSPFLAFVRFPNKVWEGEETKEREQKGRGKERGNGGVGGGQWAGC